MAQARHHVRRDNDYTEKKRKPSDAQIRISQPTRHEQAFERDLNSLIVLRMNAAPHGPETSSSLLYLRFGNTIRGPLRSRN